MILVDSKGRVNDLAHLHLEILAPDGEPWVGALVEVRRHGPFDKSINACPEIPAPLFLGCCCDEQGHATAGHGHTETANPAVVDGRGDVRVCLARGEYDVRISHPAMQTVRNLTVMV